MFLIIGVVLLILVFWFILIYNRFIMKQNLVKEAWSGIDVQLKRRYNLIPNLVNAVKGYSKHERELFEEVTKARNQAISAKSVQEQGKAENELSKTLKNLFALAENYPDLKASQTFLDLQQNLAKVEDEIQMARRYYNGTVRDLNIMVESFPSALIARLYEFKQKEFFEVEMATERQVPEVKF